MGLYRDGFCRWFCHSFALGLKMEQDFLFRAFAIGTLCGFSEGGKKQFKNEILQQLFDRGYEYGLMLLLEEKTQQDEYT